MAKAVAAKLKLNPQESVFFVSLVEIVHGRSLAVRTNAEKKLRKIRGVSSIYRPIDQNQYDLFSHWYQPAVLELLMMNDGILEEESISHALGISRVEVGIAIKCLQGIGCIKLANGKYVRVTDHLEGSSKTPKKVIRNFHKQILHVAGQGVDEIPSEKRKSISTILGFHNDQIAEVRNELDLFNDQFVEKFGSSEDGDSVYALSIQFIRLDRHGNA